MAHAQPPLRRAVFPRAPFQDTAVSGKCHGRTFHELLLPHPRNSVTHTERPRPRNPDTRALRPRLLVTSLPATPTDTRLTATPTATRLQDTSTDTRVYRTRPRTHAPAGHVHNAHAYGTRPRTHAPTGHAHGHTRLRDTPTDTRSYGTRPRTHAPTEHAHGHTYAPTGRADGTRPRTHAPTGHVHGSTRPQDQLDPPISQPFAEINTSTTIASRQEGELHFPSLLRFWGEPCGGALTPTGRIARETLELYIGQAYNCLITCTVVCVLYSVYCF
jgi:hypothetical protein